MRILTVGNTYPPHHLGGYELVWQAAVEELRRAGHIVRVLTTDHRESVVTTSSAADVHRELRWYWRDHTFPRRSLVECFQIERHNVRTFDRHVEEFRPDALSWWALGGLSLSILRRTRLPAIGWVNDDWLAYAPHVDGWGKVWPLKPHLANAARWIFCSPALQASMRRVLPDMRDSTAEMQGPAPTFTEHQPHDWSGELLYVGRIDERKGIDTAIEALAGLTDTRLRVVGSGDPKERRRLDSLAARIGVTDRISFEGAQPRGALAEAYGRADVTVFPVSWFEPFGLVPLESMAVGTPVIATGEGGSGDYLRSHENALLYPRKDPAALAACVVRLRDDPALRARLRAGGLRTAAELTEARWLAAVRREHEALSP